MQTRRPARSRRDADAPPPVAALAGAAAAGRRSDSPARSSSRRSRWRSRSSCSARSTTRSSAATRALLARISARSSSSPPSASASTSPAATRPRASASASRRACARCSTRPTCATRARSTTGTRPAQVISRATNDLYPIRYFIGWGVVQAIQSGMMIVGAADRARRRQPEARAVHRASRCRRSRCSRWRFAHKIVPDLAPGAGSGRATSPRRPTRPSSASRWCRRSAARTTCATRFAGKRRGRPRRRRCARRRRGALPAGLLFLPDARRSRRCSSSAAAR